MPRDPSSNLQELRKMRNKLELLERYRYLEVVP